MVFCKAARVEGRASPGGLPDGAHCKTAHWPTWSQTQKATSPQDPELPSSRVTAPWLRLQGLPSGSGMRPRRSPDLAGLWLCDLGLHTCKVEWQRQALPQDAHTSSQPAALGWGRSVRPVSGGPGRPDGLPRAAAAGFRLCTCPPGRARRGLALPTASGRSRPGSEDLREAAAAQKQGGPSPWETGGAS